MRLSKIMTGFHNYERQWVCQFDRNADIYSFAFLSGARDFEANILYFGGVSELPEHIPNMRLTFVCVRDRELPAEYPGAYLSSINLIVLDEHAKQMEILRILTQLFGEAARISSGRSHLIEVLHASQGLQAIIDKAYDILQNPIIVVDNSYRLLAMYRDDSVVEDRADLEEQRALGYMLKSNIDAMNRAHIYEQARARRYPLYNKDPDAKHGWITALVYIHGIEVGQIGVMDSRHPFTHVDFELVDFLCKTVSLELQKSDFYRTNQGLMHSYLLSDLLDSQAHDSRVIEQRMANLGWNLTANLYILLLADSARNFFDGKAQLITRQLHHLMPDSRWVIYHGQIVFLTRFDDSSRLTDNEELSRYLSINGLQAAVSNRFDDIINIRKYYDQAAKAYEFGHRLHPGVPLYFYADYFFYHMGQIVAEQHEIEDFYHPGVVALAAHDRAHGTCFLETLKLYLTWIDQPSVVADKLFIHKNTVFYRISKIREQFRLALDNGDERFKIHMTIKLMEMNRP